jgi:predicted RecA/RadA family phage recombinase
MAYTAYLKRRGSRITYSNSGSAISPKQVVVIVSGSTGFVGISLDTIAASTGTGELAIGGPDEKVWNLPKKSGDVFAQGAIVYWDSGNNRCTSTASGNTRCGRADVAAASAATTIDVILNQN